MESRSAAFTPLPPQPTPGSPSAVEAALPVVVLLGSLALLRIRTHFAALLGLAVALILALGVYHMPVDAAAATTGFGAAFGLFPSAGSSSTSSFSIN
jgi:hypothetical protein